MSWKERLFSGGEDISEIRPNYDTKYYLLLCVFLALHGLIIFIGVLGENMNASLFLFVLLLTTVQVGGVVKLLS